MDEIPSPAPLTGQTDRIGRIRELDALGAIVPIARVDQLAGILTDRDVETLRHLAKRGMGANSLRALMSDLGYLEAWCQAATGSPLPWPAPLDLVLKFIAHHLWDPARRISDPSHGMPGDVSDQLRRLGVLRACGPHAPSTVSRRLSSWSTLHGWQDLEGIFGSKALRKAMRLATRAQDRPRQRKSARAVDRAVLLRMLNHLDRLASMRVASYDRDGQATRTRALRDRALLGTCFAAGGRRRSEVAALLRSQIEILPDVIIEGEGPLPACAVRLGRTKTTNAEDAFRVSFSGRAARDLQAWIDTVSGEYGPAFPAIDRWGRLKDLPMTGQSVNLVLKARIAEIGEDAALYSAHGIRAGFLTECFRGGISLAEAMQRSGHKSVQQAVSYFNEADSAMARAARILE